jgi:hypothetical protein
MRHRDTYSDRLIDKPPVSGTALDGCHRVKNAGKPRKLLDLAPLLDALFRNLNAAKVAKIY